MNFQEIIQLALGTIITVVLPVLVKYILDALKECSLSYSDKIASEVTKDYLADISELIYQVTVYTTQTYVDELKAQGRFDKEAQDVAFDRTKTTVMALLNQEAKNFIFKVYGDVDLWLDTKIEQTVRETKVFNK